MELFLVGLNGLLLMAVWTFMLKKSILDSHRDRLFDLRDRLRSTFVSRGWDMNSPIYRRLRDQTNAYLTFTETYSFGEFVSMEKQFRKNPELVEAVKNRSAVAFADCPEAQQEFVESFRLQAVNVMMSYMITSSGPLVLTMLFILPFAAVHSLVASCFGAAKLGWKSMFRKVLEVRDVLIAGQQLLGGVRSHVVTVIKHSVSFLAEKLLYDVFVEEYSYDHAKRC